MDLRTSVACLLVLFSLPSLCTAYSIPATVTVNYDTNPPFLFNLTVDPQYPEVGSIINVSVDVVEENLRCVKANLSYPDGEISNEIMKSEDNFTFYTQFNVTEYGIYNLEVMAVDLANNSNKISKKFGTVIHACNSTTFNESVTLIKNPHVIINVTASGEGNVTFNLTVSPLPEHLAINRNVTEFDEGIKYLNITSKLENITKVAIYLYYTDDEIENLDENSLTMLYWNGKDWINCEDYLNREIPDGPFVYGAGKNPEKNCVYVVVNKTSYYGLGGNYLDTDNDGIPDIDDDCPNNPETFNGYQDRDGCPDEVPRKGGGGGGGGTLLPVKTEVEITVTPYIPITPTSKPIKTSQIFVTETEKVKEKKMKESEETTKKVFPTQIVLAIAAILSSVLIYLALRRRF